MIIAVIGTVLGFLTSAVVDDVRSDGQTRIVVAALELPAQFGPLRGHRAPDLASPSAPEWRLSVAPEPETASVRAFLPAARTNGAAR